MLKIESHTVIAALKQLTSELGRPPTRDEFVAKCGMDKPMRRIWGNYSVALQAAGIGPVQSTSESKIDKKTRFKYQSTKIDSLTVHTPSLKELFKLAGNPDVLKLVAQPDTHIPYHDEPAIKVFVEFLKYYKPHAHLIMGDFADCNGISHWPSDTFEPRRLIPEMKVARKILQEIVDVTPQVTSRFFLEGNHEDWLRQALVAKIPELADIGDLLPEGIDLDVPTMLNLRKWEYDYIPLNHLLKIGDAHFMHGIYTNEHHAKKHLSRFKASVYYGHLHDGQFANDSSISGNLEAGSLGCLCRMDAKFLKGRPNHWIHSIGIFEFRPNGSYTLYRPRIVNGIMSYNGQLFDGNK